MIMSQQLTAMTKVLEEMGQIPKIFGSAIVSQDGLLVTSFFSTQIDGRFFAAMCATMTSAAMAMGQSIGSVSTQNISIRLDRHEILCTSCSNKYILVVIFDKPEEVNFDLLNPFIDRVRNLSKNF